MIAIDRLAVDEGQRLRRIRLASLQDAPDAFSSTYGQALTLPASDWSDQIRKLPTFIAVVDGVDRGIIRCAPDLERTDGVYLMSMWVAPDARGIRAGEKLIDAVIDWARAGAFAVVTLDVGDENGPATALYARKGFSPTGETGIFPSPREHIRELRMVRYL